MALETVQNRAARALGNLAMDPEGSAVVHSAGGLRHELPDPVDSNQIPSQTGSFGLTVHTVVPGPSGICSCF